MAAPYCQSQSDSMTSDFKRRVERNTVLKYQNALSPLFEAIMNSVDAIHERTDNKPGDGKIVIDIERDDSQGLLDEHQHHIEAHPVRSFKVRDNGIGVTNSHFEAFGIADTPYRSAQGGKGLGRLIWLKAFDHAEIRSVFEQGKQRLLRTFSLCLTAQGIEQSQVRTATETDGPIGTEIRLCNYHSEYQKEVPKSAAAIGNRIIEKVLVRKCFEPRIASRESGPLPRDREDRSAVVWGAIVVHDPVNGLTGRGARQPTFFLYTPGRRSSPRSWRAHERGRRRA